MLFLLLLASCTQRQDIVTPPWANQQHISDTAEFDLAAIQQAGELIGLTLSGPDTYYTYRGQLLGTQYLLGERFATEIGVRLRIEVCRDSAELKTRLAAGDGDVILMSIDTTNHSMPGWVIGKGKPLLTAAIRQWYRPALLDEVMQEERQMFSQRTRGNWWP